VLDRRFRASGRAVILLGENAGELGGSEYLKTIHGLVRGVPPAVDLPREHAVQRLLPALAADRLIESAHDVAEGGLAVALAESCFDTGGIGIDVDLAPATGQAFVADRNSAADEQTLFGESAPLVVVSATDGQAPAVLERAAAVGLPARLIGRTGGSAIRIAIAGRLVIDVTVAEAERTWSSAIASRMARKAGAA
jgi:phosphoribosylformylglycinamidine synthase subunit PurL